MPALSECCPLYGYHFIAYGESIGYYRTHLSPEEKFRKDFWETEAGRERLAPLHEAHLDNTCVIIDGNDPEGTDATETYKKANGCSTEQARLLRFP